MTTRVGPMPTLRQSDGVFDAALEALENALSQPPVEAGAVNPLLRTLGDCRPFDITADQLTRLLRACYRLTGIEDGVAVVPSGDDAYSDRRVGWHCGTLIERSFHDYRSSSRLSIEQSVDHARVLHPDHVENRRQHYTPLPNVPLHRAEARELIAPFLAHWDRRAAEHPTAHLKTAWDAVTNPLPPFDGLVWDWLDHRGEGEDMRLALALHGLTERGQQRVGWSRFETHVLPLLAHDNPVVVAHAARFIGQLFGDADELMQGQGAWSGARILLQIAGLPRHRRTAAGGFLNGIDCMDPDPFAELTRIAPELDLGEWVMAVLSDHRDEPYIPGAQMFWFYLHEHYDRDPDMVLRMIDAGHLDVAWMCITENNPPADGMERPLERLASGPDESYAELARRLLDRLAAAPAQH